MTRGPVIHGVLLVVALLFAYQTWTREKKVEPRTGDVVVWQLAPGSIGAVVYDSPNLSIRLEKRQDGAETYWWGIEATTVRDKLQNPLNLPKSLRPDDTPKDPDMFYTVEKQFAAGDGTDELIGHLTELRALRKIADLDEEKKKEYGLDKSDRSITVSYQGGHKNLVVGATVFGTKDRYVIDVETGKGYAVSGEVVGDLITGKGTLQLHKYHKYDDDQVKRVKVAGNGQTRELVRLTVDKAGHGSATVKSNTWAPAATPDQADQTMANFLKRVSTMKPITFEEEQTTDGLELLVRIDYQDQGGKTLGWYEMYMKTIVPEPDPAEPDPSADPAEPDPAKANAKADPANPDAKAEPAKTDAPADPAKANAEKPKETQYAYYMRTERTRMLMLLPQGGASQIAQDIAQLLTAK